MTFDMVSRQEKEKEENKLYNGEFEKLNIQVWCRKCMVLYWAGRVFDEGLLFIKGATRGNDKSE